jgi:hypothetical protein
MKVGKPKEDNIAAVGTEVDAPSGFRVLPVDAHVIKAGEQSPAALVRVRIVKRFILNRDNHSTSLFDPKGSNCGEEGYYDVSQEDAKHGYLLAHTDNPPIVTDQPGTLKFAEDQQRKIRQQRINDAVEKHLMNEAAVNVNRQNLTNLRERMGGESSGLEDGRII